jgi:hypothetical protein
MELAVSVFVLENSATGNESTVIGVRTGRSWLLKGKKVFSEKKDARKNFRCKRGKSNIRDESRKWKNGRNIRIAAFWDVTPCSQMNAY